MTGEAVSSRTGLFSSERLGNLLVKAAYHSWFLSKICVGLAGIAALAVADVYVGGVVLVDMVGGPQSPYHMMGWAASIATSALLLGVMGYALAKKGVALLLMLPVVAISLADIWVDGHFPTLLLFGHDAMMESWFIPAAVNPGWWALHIFTLLSLFGEFGITFIMLYLFMEIKNVKKGPAGRGTGDPDIDLDL